MGLLFFVSYFALLAAFAFVTLSLASGLLYVSELIEEHSRLAKLIGQRSIYVIMVLHVVFYFTDSLPLLQMLFSLACHIVYLQNFSSTWPLISLTSLTFLASCVLVIADHFIWFFYFARLTSEARHLKAYRGINSYAPGFTEIATFFGICVWFTPLFLFLSLSANDNALPVAAIEPSSPVPGSAIRTSPPRTSLIRSMFSAFSIDGIPRIRGRPARKDTSEGILAPHSPTPILSPLPHRPASPSLRATPYPPPPPRSPGPRVQEINVPHSLQNAATNFKLDTPPRRTAPSRQGTGDSLGLGITMRRTASSMGQDD